VSGQPLFREGAAQILCAAQNIEFVEGVCAADAIAIAKDRRADVVLIDTGSLPGGSMELARTLARDCPHVRIVLLSDSERPEDVTAALEADIRGYVLKNVRGSELVRIVKAIHDGATYIPPQLAASAILHQRGVLAQPVEDHQRNLTKREDAILACVSRGLTNKEVAIALQVTEKTVKHYMTSIMEKLQVRNRVEAVLAARRILSQSPM
jgi:DNA-binding NarL/FixJ family response regulator